VLFPILFTTPVVLIAVFIVVAMTVRILREYERAQFFSVNVCCRQVHHCANGLLEPGAPVLGAEFVHPVEHLA